MEAVTVFNQTGDGWRVPQQDLFNDSSSSGEDQYIGARLDEAPGFFPDPITLNLQTAASSLHLHYQPVISIAGIIGNTLTLIMLVKDKAKQASTAQYLEGVLISNSLMLLSIFHDWIKEYSGSLYHIGGWCQFTTFVKYVSGFLSIWYVVCLAIDRFIVLYHPGQARTLCSMFRAKVVMVILAVVAIVVYLNISITVGVTIYGGMPVCRSLEAYHVTAMRLNQGDLIVNRLFPDIVISVMVCLIIHKLIKNRKCGQQPHADTSMLHNPHGMEYSAPVLTLLSMYLLIVAPLHCLKLYHMLKPFTQGGHQAGLQQFLWEQVFQYLAYTTLCLNFLIFFVTSSAFRLNLLRLCDCCSAGEEGSNVTSSVIQRGAMQSSNNWQPANPDDNETAASLIAKV